MTSPFPICIACVLSIMEMLQMKAMNKLLAYYAVLVDYARVVVIFVAKLSTLEEPIFTILSLKLIKENNNNNKPS